MKKPVKTALIIAGSVIGAVVLILIIAAVLHICPPKGPWPMPPWCEGLEIREGSDAQVTFQVNVPHSIDISAGEVYLSIDGRDRILMDRLRDMTYTATTTAAGQEELIYRYESSAGVSEDKRWRVVHSKQTVHDGVSSWGGQSLDPGFFAVLGIDPADTWGRNYNFMMVENTRDNIDTAYDRIARLGAKETSARDFFWATYDGKGKPNVDLDDLGYVIEGEIFLNDHRDEEQTQEDLDRLAKAAHDRGMEIAWRANLAFNDIGAYIFKDISSEIVTDHEKIVSQKTEAWIDHFFDEWERVLLYKAEMLNNAGYDIMIVTPSWHTPTYQGYEEKANQRWKQLISKVKQSFNGELGVTVDRYGFIDKKNKDEDWTKYDYYREADIVYMDVYHLPGTFAVEQDPTAEQMIQGWNTYLDKIEQRARDEGIKISLNMGITSVPDAINRQRLVEFYDFFNPEVKATKPDWQHQADAYEAFFRAMEGRTEIERLTVLGYWWDDFMDPEIKPRVSLAQSIRNKDAEAVVAKWGTALAEQ